jgi:transposase
METKRNLYTKEFKVEAVRLVVEEGRRISEVSHELEISEGLRRRRKQQYEEGKEQSLFRVGGI